MYCCGILCVTRCSCEWGIVASCPREAAQAHGECVQGAILRPWRTVPTAKPAFSHLSVFREADRLAIFSPRLTVSTTLTITILLVIELLIIVAFSAPGTAAPTVATPAIVCSLVATAIAVLVCAVAVRLFVRQSFVVTPDKWTVTSQDSRWCGLASTRLQAEGRTADLRGARVVSTRLAGGEVATNIEFLEGDAAAARVVYAAAAAGAEALAVTEQEFVAAQVNHYLERTQGRVDETVENEDAVAVADGADSLAGLPPFGGAGPFARPTALVTPAPLAGARMQVTQQEGETVVTLGRDLPVNPTVNLAGMVAYMLWIVYIGIRSGTPVWSLFICSFLALSMLPMLKALASDDQLVLSSGTWSLTQHALRGRMRVRGRSRTQRKVEQRGDLRDLIGAKARPPLSPFRGRMCCNRPCGRVSL